MSGKIVSPPPLPQDVLQRVLRLAAADGRLLLTIAGVFALLAAAVREGPGTVAGVLAAGAGALELHGVSILRQGEPRGLRWLVGSQGLLLLVVIAYAVVRLMLLDTDAIAQHITPEIDQKLAAAGMTRDELMATTRLLFQLGYGLLIVGTLCYQGGMMWFFLRRRHAVAQALQAEPPED